MFFKTKHLSVSNRLSLEAPIVAKNKYKSGVSMLVQSR
jgi:hypothetical protein